MSHMTYKLSIASLGFFLKRENLTPKATWHLCQLKCKTLRSWKKKKNNSLIRADLCDIQRKKSCSAVGSKDFKPISSITEHPLCTNQVLHQVTKSSVPERPIVVSHGPSYPAWVPTSDWGPLKLLEPIAKEETENIFRQLPLQVGFNIKQSYCPCFNTANERWIPMQLLHKIRTTQFISWS